MTILKGGKGRVGKEQKSQLVRVACVHCHGTKCPLLTAFFGQAQFQLAIALAIQLSYPYYHFFTNTHTCAKKIPLVSMGAERRVKRAQLRERGSPSATAEISPNEVRANSGAT